MIRTTCTLAIAAMLLLASDTHAAAPALSLDRADRAAEREARAILEEDRAAWDEYNAYVATCDDPAECQDEDAAWYATSYDLTPCERLSRSRALCEVVYRLNTGAACESEVLVRATSRGRVSARTLDFDCDGEPL